MLCEKCGKNTATTHIRSVVNGVVREINLCNHCAAEEGYNSITHNSLAGMLASVFEDVRESHSANTPKCPVCGATFSEIAETGKVGCAECYKTFQNELLPYLKRVHGGTHHIGKVPNSAPLIVKPQEDTVESLRFALHKLIAEEKYEEAAVVRDKIKSMEGEKNG